MVREISLSFRELILETVEESKPEPSEILRQAISTSSFSSRYALIPKFPK